MRHLPLFDNAATLAGGAAQRDDDAMLFKKAVLLTSPGDRLTMPVSGAHVGILFIRNAWSGVARITVGEDKYTVDLYADVHTNWAFEAPLRAGTGRITVDVDTAQNPATRGTQVWIQSIYTSDYSTAEVPELIRHHVQPAPLAAPALNQLTDIFKWYDPDWRQAMKALASSPPYVPPDFVHRKSWEWAQCIHGLDCLGAFDPEARALGVGVGWEPLSFFFSNYLKEVVATDLYPVDHQWSETGAREGNPKILDESDAFAPFPYRKDRLQFRRMDGKKLEFPDASFDMVWSCSSIEHFGGHAGAADSMREVERVLKPGGVACIITEYVLPDPLTGLPALFDAEYFNLRCVYEYLIRPLDRLQLVQNLDLTIPDYYVRRAVVLPDEAGAPHEGSGKPHIVLRSPSGALHTSIALFLRKAGGDVPRTTPRLFTAGETALPAPVPLAVAPRSASRAPHALPASLLAGVDEHSANMQTSPFPLYSPTGTGLKATARRTVNRLMRAVGRPQLAFSQSLRDFLSTLTTALHSHQDMLNRHSAMLARFEDQLATMARAPAAPHEHHDVPGERARENDRRQREHMIRMKAMVADPEEHERVLSRMHTRYRTYLRDVFRDRPGVLLDMGCGFAEIWFGYLRERGFTYFGMDLNDEVIAYMNALLKVQGDDSYMRQGQIEKLPFDDSFFDVVYASHILEHTIDIDKTLSEIRRILKADGYLVFAVPCGYDDEPAHTHNREREEWAEDLVRNGFTIEASGQFDFNMNEFYGRAVPRR